MFKNSNFLCLYSMKTELKQLIINLFEVVYYIFIPIMSRHSPAAPCGEIVITAGQRHVI